MINPRLGFTADSPIATIGMLNEIMLNPISYFKSKSSFDIGITYEDKELMAIYCEDEDKFYLNYMADENNESVSYYSYIGNESKKICKAFIGPEFYHFYEEILIQKEDALTGALAFIESGEMSSEIEWRDHTETEFPPFDFEE